MRRKTRPEIERQAKEILLQHGLYSLPIDPVLLANEIGISVNNAKFADDSWAAMLAKRGEVTRIFVEQSDPPYRKRFSIAHELGHHFLHMQEDGEFVDKRADMFREREPLDGPILEERAREIHSNWFAAALLMPEEFVRAEWANNPNLSRLAKVFNVSEEAMGYRLDSLDLWTPT